jgi:hypothetical protein
MYVHQIPERVFMTIKSIWQTEGSRTFYNAYLLQGVSETAMMKAYESLFLENIPKKCKVLIYSLRG